MCDMTSEIVDIGTILHKCYPLMDYDDAKKFSIFCSYENEKKFFTNFQQKSSNSLNKITIPFQDSNIFFHLDKARFKTSNSIFIFGSTIEEIISKSKNNHIITDDDKSLFSVQILNEMIKKYKDEVHSNADEPNEKYFTDQSFFVDYKKNIIFNEFKSEAGRNKYFVLKDNTNEKENDLFSFRNIFEEILKEKRIEDELELNRSIAWFRNYHSDFDRIVNRCPSKETKKKNITIA